MQFHFRKMIAKKNTLLKKVRSRIGYANSATTESEELILNLT